MNNRQFLLDARPQGMVKAADFRLAGSAVPAPREGEVLVRLDCWSLDPAMRGWMENRADYMAPLALGDRSQQPGFVRRQERSLWLEDPKALPSRVFGQRREGVQVSGAQQLDRDPLTRALCRDAGFELHDPLRRDREV